MANITLENGSLAYHSQYNADLVAALKAVIPNTDRRWDKDRHIWLVAVKYGQALADITRQYLGEAIAVPAVVDPPACTEQRLLEVRYIGTARDRGGDDLSAYGYVGGAWSVIFPEKVLREWFDQEAKPDEAPTLYAVLGSARVATADELKSAYRRMARQWHPDTCREPNAAQVFIAIKHAYDVLSDGNRRARYDAGLALEATLRSQQRNSQSPPSTATGYRSPLRCGYLLVTGHESLGRFIAESIQMWEDITRGDGKVLSTSWPVGAEQFVERWV